MGGTILTGEQDGVSFVKLVGSVTHLLGPALDSCIDRLFARDDSADVVVDLTETTYLDSTILGLLAKVANRCQERWQRPATLLSTNVDINVLLDSIGFSDIFLILHPEHPLGNALEAVPRIALDEGDHVRLLLEAHRRLAAMSDTNRTRFRDVIELLEAAPAAAPSAIV